MHDFSIRNNSCEKCRYSRICITNTIFKDRLCKKLSTTYGELAYCEDARNDEELCGERGVYFEPRLWMRLCIAISKLFSNKERNHDTKL